MDQLAGRGLHFEILKKFEIGLGEETFRDSDGFSI